MAVFAETGEEPVYERQLSNNTALLPKEAVRFREKGKTEAAYEAGSPNRCAVTNPRISAW
jgi:hypothetical protein